MSVAPLSSKGQITIPSRARKAVGIKAHDRLLIETRGREIVIRPADTLMRLDGFLGQALPPAKERSAMIRAVASRTRRRP